MSTVNFSILEKSSLDVVEGCVVCVFALFVPLNFVLVSRDGGTSGCCRDEDYQVICDQVARGRTCWDFIWGYCIQRNCGLS